jgi:hypothetical protein
MISLTTQRHSADTAAVASPAHRIDIVVPVYNEEIALERSIRRLHDFLRSNLPFAWRIVIADNASVDSTPAIARSLARELADVEVVQLPGKGRGRALRAVWSASDADILCYMDVDLSTDLRGLLPLVACLVSGHSEVAIGTRLAPGSRVIRSRQRELISRAYNRLLRVVLRARFSDAQCGFKAIRADVARLYLLLRASLDAGAANAISLGLGDARGGRRIHNCERLRRFRAWVFRHDRIPGPASAIRTCWGWNADTGEILWPENLFRLLGLTPGEIEPTVGALLERTHPDDRERVERRIEQARLTLDPSELTYRVVLPDGRLAALVRAAASLRLARSRGRRAARARRRRTRRRMRRRRRADARDRRRRTGPAGTW